MFNEEAESFDMAGSPTAKASRGPARTELVGLPSRNGAQNPSTLEAGPRGLVLRNLDEMWRFATAVIASGMAPKSLEKPEKVLVALQMGAEVGLSPMQSLANIAVVNGRPTLWGDAVVGLVRRSHLCESIREEWQGQGETRKAICCVKRRGQPEECRSFGYAEAKRAGLLSRDTYRNYPDRMYQCRARSWAIRDVFPDLLMGLGIAEEVQDQAFLEAAQPELQSGDDAPLNSLDDLAEVLAQDEPRPSSATPEELADMRREMDEEKAAAGNKLFDDIPF